MLLLLPLQDEKDGVSDCSAGGPNPRLSMFKCQLEAPMVRSCSAGLASSVPLWCELGGWRKVFKTLGKTSISLDCQMGQNLRCSQLPLPVSLVLVRRWDRGGGPFLS